MRLATTTLLLSVVIAGGQNAPDTSGKINIDDRLMISITDMPTVSEKPHQVDPDGNVDLPLMGKLKAEGLTVDQFQRLLTEQVRVYIREPQISIRLVTKVENRFAVAGGFKNPGIHPLPEQRSLMNVISAVGGLQPGAGSNVKIIRRLEMGPIPLPTAVEDPTSNVSTATVNLNRLMEDPSIMNSLVVKPNDVLSAEPPNTAYLTGEVLKPGAYDLSDRESIGLTELVSVAGGLSRDAAPEKARVLRKILNGSKRAEIPVDIVSILDGDAVDFRIQPNDIVEIPRVKSRASGAKTVLRYVLPAAASGLIYTLIRR